jgi:mannose-1-phosphate guanylyltransferase
MSKKINVLPVILCGGSGSRLWPLSRTSFPKQFLVQTGSYLGEDNIERFEGIYGRK